MRFLYGTSMFPIEILSTVDSLFQTRIVGIHVPGLVTKLRNHIGKDEAERLFQYLINSPGVPPEVYQNL